MGMFQLVADAGADGEEGNSQTEFLKKFNICRESLSPSRKVPCEER